jgi:uncharacterized protein (DUF58 family)
VAQHRRETLGQTWSRRRQGLDRLPVTTGARRIYILPTGSGLVSGVMLLAMLAAGLNYGNGLVLLLCFLLAGFVLTGLHQCHRRLLRLEIRELSLSPAFAGEHIVLALCTRTSAVQDAAELRLSLRTADGERPLATAVGDAAAPVFSLAIPVSQRGRWTLPPLRLDCEAPAGLFRSWIWLHIEADTLVYPRPIGDRPLPGCPDGSGLESAATPGQEEWASLRPYREGDSPRLLAWKAYARGAPLMSREGLGSEGRTHVLDEAALQGLDTEARLSQLSAWVLTAERRQEAWSLALSGRRMPQGLGKDHADEALAALAIHQLPRGNEARP